MDHLTMLEIKNLSIDLYKVLGLTRTASASEIRNAYHKISLKSHPDRNPNSTDEDRQFYNEVTTAYRILNVLASREFYDREHPDHGVIPSHNHITVETKLNVSISLVFTGGKKKIKIEGYFKDGNGVLVHEKRYFEVVVPRGIREGETIFKKGWGGFSKNGKDIIDIKIEVIWKKDPYFVMDGMDMLVTKEFTIKEAINGGKKKIKMPDGSFENIYIMEILKPDKILRFPNKGMPFRNGAETVRGDLLIKCKIVFPDKVSSKDKELIRQTSF